MLLGIPRALDAQNFTHVGVLPRINYTKPINDHFNINITFFSEIVLGNNRTGKMIYSTDVLNFSFVGGLAYKLDQNNIITAGYLYRIYTPFEPGLREEHRIIFQFVHLQHFGKWRLRHHIRFEERFIESDQLGTFNPVTRLSYVFGWDIPLQGRQLDNNEFYLNSVNSFFVQPTKPRTTFNNLNEFYIGLGYKTSKLGRFEVGPEAKLSVRNEEKDLNMLIFVDFIWYPSFGKQK